MNIQYLDTIESINWGKISAYNENNITPDWKGAFNMAINPFLLLTKINGKDQG